MCDTNEIDSSTGYVDNNRMPSDKVPPVDMPLVPPMPPEVETQKKKGKDTNKTYGCKWHYIVIVGFILMTSVLSFYGLSCQFKSQTENIVALHKNDTEAIQIALSSIKLPSHSRQSNFNELRDILEKHEAKEEALLELSFSKLQSDFNFISLWAGVITIVFLVFSIYSIFRTDEMLKQAQQASSEIDNLLEKAKLNYDDADNQNTATINSYKQITQIETGKLRAKLENLESEIEKVGKIISLTGK